MIYFDYAASCPLDPKAAEVFIHASSNYYGNSQSLHDYGEKSQHLLEHCRLEMAKLLHVNADGVFFTSGGTESNYLAIQALLSSTSNTGKHIIAGIAEHASIHSALNRLTADGYRISYIPYTEAGTIDLEILEANILPETALAIFQHANAEIGTIQPLEEIAALCKKHQILLHCDCVHSFGKADVKAAAENADSIAISAHKFYGPKGIGAVYIRPSIRWKSYYPGTSHENGFRPGTVNVPAAAAMTAAAQIAYDSLGESHQHAEQLRASFIEQLSPVKDQLLIYGGEREKQIASTIGLRIFGMEGQLVMLECNRQGYAISTGSACKSGMHEISKTMQAFGLEDKRGKEFIRISFGRETTIDDIEKLAKAIVSIMK